MYSSDQRELLELIVETETRLDSLEPYSYMYNEYRNLVKRNLPSCEKLTLLSLGLEHFHNQKLKEML
ncbi:hypothetical protein [Pseudomonas phage LUZ7]|uniref:Uncharacterized protein n=1 Tax=Pseudomonas phage LUZ7 TaxID=655097 RepID=C8ZKC2_9CAUD|nr:hypothetical protein PP-LUZ7_gp023 [Pseudomonas phage LUZ7]CAZ66164.1 hypothetical protein [Pseudomonas phage LUZ7]